MSSCSSTVSSSSDNNLEHSNNLELKCTKLRHYFIIDELGRGSFSIVWLCYNNMNKKFCAIKVQDPNEYKSGIDEIKFVSKLPKDPPIFNNLLEYFIENKNNNKYLCSVWNLHNCNLDFILRKSSYTNGLPIIVCKKIMKQLIQAIQILHKKFKVYHGDIKTDNILVKGISMKNKFICDKYLEYNSNNNNNKSFDEYYKDFSQEFSEDFSKNFLEKIQISLSDFGAYCKESEEHTKEFGTRYYQAPEIILLGKCSYPVDIWALGCTFYEMLSSKILFDPIKDSHGTRDYYHLCLINETCGSFPYNFIKKTKKYKEFFIDTKLKNFVPKENRLDRKLEELSLSDISDKENIKDILKSLLHIDPNKRSDINYLSTLEYFNISYLL
jgi:serine/threonine protein kinase